MASVKKLIKSIWNKEQRELIGHFKNYLMGNFATRALSFISIPILTRLLTTSEYGLISTINSTAQVLTIILVLNFNSYIARKYYDKDSNFGSFMFTIIAFLIIYNVVFLSSIYFFKDVIAGFLNQTPKLFIIAIITSVTSIFITLYYAYLQASMQSKQYSIIAFLRASLGLVIGIVWIIMLDSDKHLGRLYASIIVNVIFSIYAVYRIVRICEFKLDVCSLKNTFSYSIPLLPHALSGFILSQFDRIIINQLNGSSDAGLYSFAYNVGMLMYIVVLSLNKSWTPILYKKLNEKDTNSISSHSVNNTKIVLLCALGLILFAKEVVIIMAKQSYYSALPLVPIVVIGYVMYHFYTLYVGFAFYKKNTTIVAIITIIASVLNVVLNYIYIPKFGYIAGAYTTLVSYAVMFILNYLNSRYLLKYRMLKGRSLLPCTILFVILALVFYVLELDTLNFVLRVIGKLVLIAVYGTYMYFSVDRAKNKSSN